MSRKPRIHVDGGFYHVIFRGNARQDIFLVEADYAIWQSIIDRAIKEYGHRLHAYCWMTNHIHMAIQAGTKPLAKSMSFLASQYARRFNMRHGRSGHLFERRYRSILVQEEQYLKELTRYIHLNPVRARMVQSPGDHKWSSHNAYLGQKQARFLFTDYVLALFGSTLSRARHNYRLYMQETSNSTMLEQLRTGSAHDDRVLGNDSWLAQQPDRISVVRPSETLNELITRICGQHGVTESELAAKRGPHHFSSIRAEIALRASETGLASISEVARRFNRSQPSLSRSVQRLKKL
ncbi:MAG: transposase [Gammaproteobacteria bacterium]|nr:transposase [Gammaproteobacteria bacterium]MCP4091232.1 transposase [Gammaproteobacteria bacterium]MCP4278341.1 transposase [Gammaproteobacteria bacterium]MCP4830918.1 transposase [Gammaproteobacteria bacterium]MCP4928917.1 transposase [Gammaproteobacteria bacterium]